MPTALLHPDQKFSPFASQPSSYQDDLGEVGSLIWIGSVAVSTIPIYRVVGARVEMWFAGGATVKCDATSWANHWLRCAWHSMCALCRAYALDGTTCRHELHRRAITHSLYKHVCSKKCESCDNCLQHRLDVDITGSVVEAMKDLQKQQDAKQASDEPIKEVRCWPWLLAKLTPHPHAAKKQTAFSLKPQCLNVASNHRVTCCSMLSTDSPRKEL